MRNGLPVGEHKAGLRAYLRRHGEKKWRGQVRCLGHKAIVRLLKAGTTMSGQTAMRCAKGRKTHCLDEGARQKG